MNDHVNEKRPRDEKLVWAVAHFLTLHASSYSEVPDAEFEERENLAMKMADQFKKVARGKIADQRRRFKLDAAQTLASIYENAENGVISDLQRTVEIDGLIWWCEQDLEIKIGDYERQKLHESLRGDASVRGSKDEAFNRAGYLFGEGGGRSTIFNWEQKFGESPVLANIGEAQRNILYPQLGTEREKSSTYDVVSHLASILTNVFYMDESVALRVATELHEKRELIGRYSGPIPPYLLPKY